ncbi:hypothetical protein BSKO_12706 [Bryopsis sp. KO-2023]|nr:hypothetical protein BSKO_12706 [Bryopsis sp. KO-2023]
MPRCSGSRIQTRQHIRAGVLGGAHRIASNPRKQLKCTRFTQPPTIGRRNHVIRAALAEKPSPAEDVTNPNLPQYKPKTAKPRVVVLGSGWGAASFMKSISEEASKNYELILVSPRNYFLYTPLLPAVATGTMEERSIVEPVRNIVQGKGDYFEAVCQAVDPETKTLVACFPKDAGLDAACFKVPYDILVVAVGSVNNTFGIKGVDENCFYFKSIGDASKLRRRISESFERAALPHCSSEERNRLLSFVLVGGGPTGVEVAAELYDMINDDLSRLYPDLMQYANITIIDLLDHVLSAYDRRISDYTRTQFQRVGIKLVLNSKVESVSPNCLTIKGKSGELRDIEFGTCVWATGIAKNPLIEELQQVVPGQSHFRSIITDGHLRVKGSEGSMFALGDAATINQNRALEYVDELFERADKNKNGELSLPELRGIMSEASKEFPQFREYELFFGSQGSRRFGNMVREAFQQVRKNGNSNDEASAVVGDLKETDVLTKAEFADLLAKIDKGLRALPATAQVARQQGEFLADLFSRTKIEPGCEIPEDMETFQYSHKGSLAYVGTDKAVMDLPVIGPLWGFGAGLVWKSFETYSQISSRNQLLVALDWLRTKLFGRDISRV